LPERAIYTPGGRWKAISLRLGDWKLVVSGDTKRELFHISKDPSETTNLAEQQPERLKTMLAALRKARANDNEIVWKPQNKSK
jgi:arylsulfatase A-like enzyme